MLELRLLGPLAVTRGGEAVPIGSPTQRLILGVLAARSAVVPRDRLLDAIWGEQQPRTAETSLSAYVSRLRRALGSEAIVHEPPGYVLQTEWLDITTFERLLEQAATDDAATAAARLEEALGLWRGAAFAELADHPYIRPAAQHLQERRATAGEQLAAAQLEVDRPTAAVGTLRALVAEEPLRERAWILLIDALTRAGRKAEALEAARRCRHELAAVGLDPQAELDRAEQAAHDLAAGSLSDPAEPRPQPAGNLPIPVSSFVGRKADVRQLADLLGGHRLVTLVGPGGVGKTRLAIETLRRLPRPPAEGIWLCDLAAVGHDEAVAPAVAAALGLPAAGDAQQRLVDHVSARSLLLVLDNCDHVLDGTAALIERVVPHAPALRVVATSREPLGVAGEHVVEVAPLDPDTEAVTLFTERARSAGAAVTDEDADTIRTLTRWLDGLPLAVEMAAPWARTMAVGDLDQHLRQRLDLHSAQRLPDGRHRSLRDVLAWSVSRLAAPERCLFRRLSVLAGSFSLEAAKAVAGSAPLAPDEVPALLRSLVRCSLVVPLHGGPGSRFRMLETVAEYAVEQRLDAEPDGDAATRKIDHFTALAERVAQGLRGPEEVRWAEVADRDLHHLASSAESAAAIGPADAAVRIPAALYLLVLERLRSDVAIWARACLRAVDGTAHPQLPALRAVVALGQLQAGDLARAEGLARQAIEEAGDEPAARFGHHVRCELAYATGRHTEGLAAATEVIRRADAADDRYLAAHAVADRCLLLGYRGQREQARQLATELRHRARAVGAPTLQATADYVEGELLLESDLSAAIPLLDRAVATASAAGSAFIEGAARLSAVTGRVRHGEAHDALGAFRLAIRHWKDRGDWIHQWPTLRNLCVVLTEAGAHEAATTLLGAVEALGGEMFGDEAARVDAARGALIDRLGPEAVSALLERGRSMDRDDLVSFALASTAATPEAESDG